MVSPLIATLLATATPSPATVPAIAPPAPVVAPPTAIPAEAPRTAAECVARAMARSASRARAPLPEELQVLVDRAIALHGVLATPDPAAEPVVDGPDPDVETMTFEIVLPAEMPRIREAHSETTLTVPRNTSLVVTTFAGAIDVRAWHRDEVRVTANHARRDRLRSRLDKGALQVQVVDRRGEPAFGDIRVLVPEWMPVRVSSMESPIDVEGLRAAVEAGSVHGDVVVRRVRGPVDLRSVEGLVRLLDVQGRVQAASINNLVRLEKVVGGIDAESVNGDIQLSEIESPDVDASSVNGSVAFEGPFQRRGRYRLVSHNGNLRVGVPVGSDVDVWVHNFRGGFQSGLPQPVAPHPPGRRFTFTLGDGGSTLELQSFQGQIQLLRAPDAPAPPPAPAPPAPRKPAAPQEEDR